MSESKIKYQFVAMPAKWVTSFKLSAQEKITLAALILNSNKENEYNKGYQYLADQSCISLRQCKYIVEALINRGYIIKKTGTKPIILQANFAPLGGDVQNSDKSALDCTLSEKKECNPQQLKVQFSVKNSAVDCTQSRYIDLNPETRACAREKMDGGDVTPPRSMPTIESARIEKADDQCELEDFLLADSFFRSFPDLKAWCKFSKLHGEIILEAFSNTRFINSKFNELFDEKRADIDKFFAEKNQKLRVFEEKPSKNRTIFIKNIEKTTD